MKLAAALISALLVAQPIGAQPAQVLNAEKAWMGADVLLPLARSDLQVVREAAVRALGRLEDPALVPTLITLPAIGTSLRGQAIAQSLHGFDPAKDPKLIQAVFELMQITASM